ncbi:SMR family transporter [Marinobacter caseinilyticus]|uniref:SMR family transporter n=1 Tax=Marinobacter caseinilyticus TaxID=2692195 RepID=UPI00140B6E12|nr:SMR family transporter [Marinobacter caseinilyticus]
MSHWVLLAIAIAAEVFGTSFLKASDGFSRLWPSIAVVLSYMLAFYFLALTLKVIPVGIAYAIWAGAGVALITLIGWAILGQALDGPAIVGIAMIVSGVVVLNVFSSSVPH